MAAAAAAPPPPQCSRFQLKRNAGYMSETLGFICR